MHQRSHTGFTLIELMVTIVVLAILIAIAVPSFAGAIDRRRISDAAEAVAKQVQQGRMAAMETSRRITMVIDQDADPWCFGLTDNADCDCTEADSCQIPFRLDVITLQPADYEEVVGLGTLFRGVDLAGAPALMTFEPRLGARELGLDVETIVLTSERGLEARIMVNRVGRVAVCSPAGAAQVSGMALCP
jgi:type IV fimbrial biogenesis protein FimT